MGEGAADLVRDHVDCDAVFDSARDDDVGEFALGGDVFVEVGFDEAEPLFDAAFDVAAAFFDVSDHYQISVPAKEYRSYEVE